MFFEQGSQLGKKRNNICIKNRNVFYDRKRTQEKWPPGFLLRGRSEDWRGRENQEPGRCGGWRGRVRAGEGRRAPRLVHRGSRRKVSHGQAGHTHMPVPSLGSQIAMKCPQARKTANIPRSLLVFIVLLVATQTGKKRFHSKPRRRLPGREGGWEQASRGRDEEVGWSDPGSCHCC